MTVVVVTDSSASLDRKLAEKYGIRVVPLHVLVDGKELREGVDEIPESYLSGSATTSGASPGELLDAYERAFEASDGDGVVAVHISRKLSATWEAARQAETEFTGGIRIVDSLSAAMGVGFPALAAARCAALGGSLDDVYDAAISVTLRSRSLVVVDRLDHLRRGGRISTAAALVGTALAMKPVLHMVEGKLVPKEKTRTSSKALGKLVDAAVKDSGTVSVAAAVQHISARERADRVADQLRERIPNLDELIVTDFGPTLGVHLGPGAVGVVVVPGGAGSPT
ncbi:DegV family protein [Antrihabitans sp. YC2-6]|uniref:DegV family protein n=1 Tax=Antrihabitans sp. YC2-6 TaxID=2799498 RepID=UPI0018F44FEF|nr:DegV family protein [Antrihabitans sp. YC2-6]MBJ8346825.1 DegV family protein [Antrihabitans sp. YC2-6]